MIDKSIHNLFDSISDTGLLALVKINPAQAKSFFCHTTNQGYAGTIDFA